MERNNEADGQGLLMTLTFCKEKVEGGENFGEKRLLRGLRGWEKCN